MKRNLNPDTKTEKGRLIETVLTEHPLVRKVWNKEKEESYRPMSDTACLRSLVNDYDNISNSSYKHKSLPYSVLAHIKLKNILKYGRIH